MSNGAISRKLMGDAAGEDTVIARADRSIGMEAEKSRAIAEIQAALTVAQARGRDEGAAIDRILIACQRPGLAEVSEYSYSRGGTEITGPNIDLLTVIANCWGNIQFGFRELSQSFGSSEVEAFAWDLQSNSKRVVTFTVSHRRTSNGSSKMLTDPRDIYELVANYAQRRVRACLEAIIPPDVVDMAVQQCKKTTAEKDPVTPERIKKLADSFKAKFGIEVAQIEKRIGRRLDTLAPAQMSSLRRIWKSLDEGMSKPGDWFKPLEDTQEAPATGSVKDKLKAQAAAEAGSETDKTEEGN